MKKLPARLLALASLALLGGCATTIDRPSPALPAGAKYVAMGSSFAAGAAIGPTKPGTPERCGRTVNNYASLLAEELQLTLDDQSCGGAKTAHILHPWNELPAQIDAVDADTRLVTITIGGNDLNYVGYLFMASCPRGEVVKAGGYEITCTAPDAPEEAAFARLESALKEVSLRIQEKAPDARVVFVQYVTMVTEEPCAALSLSAEDAATARNIGVRLAAITERAALSTGAEYLPADRLSQSHTACDADPWSNAVVNDLSRGAPWHPNASGHEAIARTAAGLL